MYTEAKFEIIGRVGNVKSLNGVAKLSVATDRNFKDDNGDWVERTDWNEVSIFGDEQIDRVMHKFAKGDLVKCSGAIASNSFEKDGQTHYGVTLTCRKLNKLAQGRNS